MLLTARHSKILNKNMAFVKCMYVCKYVYMYLCMNRQMDGCMHACMYVSSCPRLKKLCQIAIFRLVKDLFNDKNVCHWALTSDLLLNWNMCFLTRFPYR